MSEQNINDDPQKYKITVYHYDDNDCNYACKTINKTADLIDRFLETVKREANK